MDRRRSSHTSPSTRPTKKTKGVFSRLFKSVEQADIDEELAAWEEAIHHSSFALLPVVLTPSRGPSNASIASSRAPFFEKPMVLDFASGLDKGPVIEWYHSHRSKGPTLIEKLQLRKDLQPPYYHECIVVFTRSGHRYRVDRRPDADAPFDTIMKAGCKTYDMIQTVGSRSLTELQKTSDCVVELHWPGERTIDLLLILSVCFALSQDQQARQYTLQRYNCYFLSWTIVMIAMRDTAAWETRLNTVITEVFSRDEWKENLHVTGAVSQVLERALDWERELERLLDWQRKLERERGRTNVFGLVNPQAARARALALARELGYDSEVGSDSEVGYNSEVGYDSEVGHDSGLDQGPVLQAEEYILRQAMKAVRQVVGDDLMLELNAPGGEDNAGQGFNLNVMLQPLTDKLQELMRQGLDPMSKLLFPGDLDIWQSRMLKTVQSRRVTRSSTYPKHLLEVVLVVHQLTAGAEEDLARSAVSQLVMVPASLLAVSLTCQDSNSKPSVSNLQQVTHNELEQYLMKVIANHAKRVARLGLATAAEVERDMLDGMKRMWLFVLQHPLHIL